MPKKSKVKKFLEDQYSFDDILLWGKLMNAYRNGNHRAVSNKYGVHHLTTEKIARKYGIQRAMLQLKLFEED